MINRKDCCGCNACVSICPQNCISFVRDAEGFDYPVINDKKCIHCGLCERVCPALHTKESSLPKIAYACKNKNPDIQKRSSSGGVFSVLANYVLLHNGVVFGAMFDENFNVGHAYIDDVKDLPRLRGSKYVQSNISHSYIQAKTFLDSGKQVLFSGTSCQIAGLKCFLRREYENLLTVDVVCHGVASPGVFQNYIYELQQKEQSQITDISFRDKSKGWINFCMKIVFKNGKVYQKALTEDEYLRGFIANIYLRPSCYHCVYKSGRCGSDFSIADYWGIRGVAPDFFDSMGVSLLIVHTKIGRTVFDEIQENLECIETSMRDAIKCNSAIVSSAHCPKNRKKFYRQFKKGSTIEAINFALTPSLRNKVSLFIYGLVKKYKLSR